MPENYDKYQVSSFNLTICSPFHIRGKNYDHKENFLQLNRKNDKFGRDYAYQIDMDAIVEWLEFKSSEGRNYLCLYTDYFTEKRDKDGHNFRKRFPDRANDKTLRKKYEASSLELFLRENNLIKEMEKIEADNPWMRIFKGRVFIGRDKSFIQSSKGAYYIPGSSLKGAIRTAVLYSIVKGVRDNDPDWFCREIVLPVVEKIKEFLKVRDNKLKTRFSRSMDEILLKRLFPVDLDLKSQQGKPNAEQRDLMRVFKVADIPLSSEDMYRENVLVMTLKNKNEPYEKATIRGIECLREKVSARGQIAVDLELLERFYKGYQQTTPQFAFPFKNFSNPALDISQMLNDFAREQWCEDCGYYKRLGTLIDAKLERSYRQRPYSCFKYGHIEKPERGNAYFAKEDRRQKRGAFVDDKSILHKKPQMVRSDLQPTIFADELSERGPRTRYIFSYDFSDRQYSRSKRRYRSDLKPLVDFYDDKTAAPNLRLGWGTGLLGMTINLAFDPILRKLIRDEVLLGQLRNLPAPKSRRFVIRDNKPYLPLGWCRFELK